MYTVQGNSDPADHRTRHRPVERDLQRQPVPPDAAVSGGGEQLLPGVAQTVDSLTIWSAEHHRGPGVASGRRLCVDSAVSARRQQPTGDSPQSQYRRARAAANTQLPARAELQPAHGAVPAAGRQLSDRRAAESSDSSRQLPAGQLAAAVERQQPDTAVLRADCHHPTLGTHLPLIWGHTDRYTYSRPSVPTSRSSGDTRTDTLTADPRYPPPAHLGTHGQIHLQPTLGTHLPLIWGHTDRYTYSRPSVPTSRSSGDTRTDTLTADPRYQPPAHLRTHGQIHLQPTLGTNLPLIRGHTDRYTYSRPSVPTSRSSEDTRTDTLTADPRYQPPAHLRTHGQLHLQPTLGTNLPLIWGHTDRYTYSRPSVPTSRSSEDTRTDTLTADPLYQPPAHPRTHGQIHLQPTLGTHLPLI